MLRHSKTREIAVFDVDETLIHCKSMFSFLRFALFEKLGSAEGEVAYESVKNNISKLRKTSSREVINAQFYKVFKGWRISELNTLAKRWFITQKPDDFFIHEVLEFYRKHQKRNADIVLLSGSAKFIIEPIAEYLDSNYILAIQLSCTNNDLLDGNIYGIQTIGQGKAKALKQFLLSLNDSQLHIVGYGDHESDLPFLNICDDAYVVHKTPTFPSWASNFKKITYS